MLEDKTLQFGIVNERNEPSFLQFPVRHVICAGYSGRSQDAVQEHVKELQALGLPAPESTPILFKVSPYLATTATSIAVQNRSTSGEVEFALLFHGGDIYVTCGSDHTDRALEKHSIPGAKQMYPKVLAKDAWPFAEAMDEWDRMILRSWAHSDGVRKLYQEAALSHILAPGVLMDHVRSRFGPIEDGTILMSGTIPTAGGELVYADSFSFELHDTVRHRTIRHSYEVMQLG